MQQVVNSTTHESAAGTETEPRRNSTESCTDHGQGLPQQTVVYSPPLSSPPVLIIHSISASGDQSEMSPAPVVCVAVFDDGQSPSYDQDQILRKPVQHVPSMRAKKNVKFALRRSYSAAEALTLSHAGTTDTESQCVSTPLTDYPYVLHAFEVLGKDQAHVRSLPNMHRLSEHYANLDFNPNPSTGMKAARATGQDNQNRIQYTNIGTVNFNKLELDDELSYSYPNKRRVVRIISDSLPRKVSGEYSDDDHPLNWAPTPQLAKSLDSKLPVHKETNDILPPVKSQNTPRNKQKPPITPRKKIVNQAAHRNDGANLASQNPHKYTGLLSSTRESIHQYTYLQKGATELNELITSDTDVERAYPNEWYN